MIVDLVESATTRKGYSVSQEQAFLTPEGILRPDLVLFHDSATYMFDVTVVSENADIEQSHKRKCEYYNTPAIYE